MTESERLDAELTRVEARVSALDDEFYTLQRRADDLRLKIENESDSHIRGQFVQQLGQTVDRIHANRDSRSKEDSLADEVALQLRAELKFQEERALKPKPDPSSTSSEESSETFSPEEWLEKRKLKMKKKLKP